jgi:hypothetical protein
MGSKRATPSTIRQSVVEAVGDDRIEQVLYREQRNTLSDPEYVWREYESVADLPQLPLDGWEELVVFTDARVYRWVQTGFESGPTVVPRNPNAILPEPSFLAD